MSLDILELIVHHNLHVRGCRDVFSEEGGVLLERFGLDLANGLAAFGDVSLEFVAGLLMLAFSSHKRDNLINLHAGKARALE